MRSLLHNLGFKKKVPLLEQLSALAQCGITLRSGKTEADLLAQFEAKFYEAEPYKRLMPVLGGEGGLSDDILLLDTGCFRGDGSYASVLASMVAMTRGALPLTDLKDSLDDPASAWVQFRLRGRTQRWSVERDSDWIDPTILGRMAGLLEQVQTRLQYVFASSGGKTALVACLTPENTKRLRELSGLEFKPLTTPDA